MVCLLLGISLSGRSGHVSHVGVLGRLSSDKHLQVHSNNERILYKTDYRSIDSYNATWFTFIP